MRRHHGQTERLHRWRSDGVVVVPQEAAEKVVEFLKLYDDKESKMIPIIKEEKSMLKALEKYNRY